jgi:hypothetical protein
VWWGIFCGFVGLFEDADFTVVGGLIQCWLELSMGIYDLACVFIGLPPILVRHQDLVRVDDSKFRSVCPTCKHGFLPVRRDQVTLELLDDDFCVLCGQAFVYVDPPWRKVKS